MKILLRVLLFGCLLYVGYYMLTGYVRTGEVGMPPALEHYAERLQQRFLCQVPIGWRIGELDPAFDLTREEAEAAGRRAAALWNDAVGQTLFVYDDAKGFPINFSYDERQQEILRAALLERNIASYDQEIENRLAVLQFQDEALRQQLQQFAQEKEELAADITALQHQLIGDVPPQRRLDLEQQWRQLAQRQKDLQAEAERLKGDQRRLQREQHDINAIIRERNDLLPAAHRAPVIREVGLMEIHEGQRTMTIFAFQSQKDLVLTMAHEFGHALGLDHTEAADSLMYIAISPSQQGITEADIAAFRRQCPE
jgi:hypothetical protein